MAAENEKPVAGLGLRSASRMANIFGVELLRGSWIVGWRINRTGASREARAPFRDGCEALSVAAQPLHDAHHAVMLAVPAAAGGEIRVGIGAKEGRHQHPAEDDRERKCDYAAHGQETV